MPLLLPLLLTSCSVVEQLSSTFGEGGPPDIVLITVDGLRADLGQSFAEGALIEGMATHWDRSPTLRFRSAYAQTVSPYTSTVSMLVGRYPTGVPVCGRPAPDRRLWCTRVPDFQRPLPEVLSLYGYQTAYTFEHLPVGEDLMEIFPKVLHHNTDTTISTDWYSMRAEAAQWWKGEPAPKFLMASFSIISGAEFTLMPGQVQGIEPTPEAWEDTRRHYREMAREVGLQIGEFLDDLGGRPYVIVTSSHGMNLGEPGATPQAQLNQVQWPTHMVLNDRTLRVPLLIFEPGGWRTREVSQPVELIDIFPTLARLGGAVPPADLSGQDLLTLADSPEERPAYAEFGDMLALRRGPYFMIFRAYNHGGNSMDPNLTKALDTRIVEGDARFDRNYMLYDLSADPLQERNLFLGQKALAEELRKEMLAIRAGPAAPPDGSLTLEEINSLRKQGVLGYW